MYCWLRLKVGTGKSTLVKFIVAALDIDEQNDVCYVAYTGKAATVLQQKGCPNATTAHQLLYHAKPMPNGTFKFTEKLSIDYKIVVVEKFGYGFSDVVDKERNIDSVLEDTRAALIKAGVKGPYVLCPHSMSGIEALYWSIARAYSIAKTLLGACKSSLGN